MRNRILRVAAVVACVGLAAFGFTQLREAIKILGVGAAVRQFGPEMNKGMNRLLKHTDTSTSHTKVVPIITIGLNTRGAIGAAQVKGAKVNVDKVRAVAAPEAQLFGREIMLRGMVPVSESDPTKIKDLVAVEGVGVSGIIDLRL
jgi:hypothetical protein